MKWACKKCLLAEMDKDAYYESMYEYIALLPVDVKTEEEEYQRRLSLCKQCDNLESGMCRKCGCFVEVRAAKKVNYCPSENKYW